MRKSLLQAVLLLASVLLTAAEGGGVIGEKLTPFKPVYLSGAGAEFDPEQEDSSRGWVLAVFFQLPDNDLQEMELMLSGVLGDRGEIVFISGAPEDILGDYAALLPAEMRGMNIAWDSGSRIAKRVLPGNVVLPFAVLADCTGEMVWMGEPMEFADVFPAILSGEYSSRSRKKAVSYYSELASAIRSGNFPSVKKSAESILAAEPANPTAVQALMFFMENSGDRAGAWRTLQTAMTNAPESIFLTMLALNFGARHGDLAGDVLASLRPEVFKRAGNRQKLSAAFMLLNGYGFEIAALDTASGLLDSVTGETPEVLEFKALCSYRQGDIAAAVKFQEAACAKVPGGNRDMQKRLSFYKTLAERLDK